MTHVPEDLRYSKDHEWVAHDEESAIATVGITRLVPARGWVPADR